MPTRLLTALVLGVAASGCIVHRGPEPIGDPSSARIGWVIMQGDGDNPDEEFVCQSNPRTACEITASAGDRRIFSDVHLYLHPTGASTRYQGTAETPFLS